MDSLPQALERIRRNRQDKENSLNLSSFNLSELPAELFELVHLEELYLNDNQLGELPRGLLLLDRLKFIDLRKNRIAHLPPWLASLPKLEEVDLGGNPLQTPPEEVANQGLGAIANFFRQQTEQGTLPLREAKLILVGEPGAGKTSLMRKLLDPGYHVPNPKEDSTLGIDVRVGWTFPFPPQPELAFQANIWDFGGQEIQHMVHQFFLTSRALYVLVADDRKQHTDFDYWFNIVNLLGGGSPVLVVLNENQHRSITNFDLPSYRKHFPNLNIQVMDVDLARDDGRLKVLTLRIQQMLSSLAHVGDPLPALWPKVREELELRKAENHMPVAEYFAICRAHGLLREGDMLILSQYLHDLGVLLHFQHDPKLQDTLFLNPQWTVDGVYVLLRSAEAKAARGRFSRQWLYALWEGKGYAFHERSKLLNLMLKDNFELCYPINGRGQEFLAPQLMPLAQPEHPWKPLHPLRFRLRYPFMPKGIVPRLVVRLSQHILTEKGIDLVWQKGAFLRRNSATALLLEEAGRADGLKLISLELDGTPHDKKELLTIIREEVRRIHLKSFPKVFYQELIPCNCPRCLGSPDPYFFKHDVLLRHLAKERKQVLCDYSSEDVDIESLLYGVLDRDEVEAWRQRGPNPPHPIGPSSPLPPSRRSALSLPHETAEELRQGLLEARWEEVFLRMVELTRPDDELCDQVRSLYLSHNDLEAKSRIGMLTQEQERVEKVRIQNSLLDILSDLEAH